MTEIRAPRATNSKWLPAVDVVEVICDLPDEFCPLKVIRRLSLLYFMFSEQNRIFSSDRIPSDVKNAKESNAKTVLKSEVIQKRYVLIETNFLVVEDKYRVYIRTSCTFITSPHQFPWCFICFLF